ncbi:hypothetical protein [Antrihabitans cavernicola]|uniref:Uncharacterized protein n=1 Tax=Antrihabitans cavernicola TaxID=2495913 RepID=A0A5A7SEP0_9NOCA|nr:hypothetical protein [Spelaeibacter cavernicola]KAA0024610.1 hypothetical protein FOY51_01255 [Spelaeibacter cavernicola]
MIKTVAKLLFPAVAVAAIALGAAPMSQAAESHTDTPGACAAIPSQIADLKAREKTSTDPQEVATLKQQVNDLNAESTELAC